MLTSQDKERPAPTRAGRLPETEEPVRRCKHEDLTRRIAPALLIAPTGGVSAAPSVVPSRPSTVSGLGGPRGAAHGVVPQNLLYCGVNIIFHPTMNPNGFEIGVIRASSRREARIGQVRRVGWIWRNNYTYTRHRSRKSATAELIRLAPLSP